MKNLNRIAGALILLLVFCTTNLTAQERSVCVIQVSFSDTDFDTSEEERDAIISRSVEYLQDQGIRVSCTNAGIVTLSNPLAYYGSNSAYRYDNLIHKAVYEACVELDKTVDFKQFDSDKDGKADLVLIVAAGGNEALGEGEDCIWPQQNRLSEIASSFSVDGITIDRFAIITEKCGAGVFCHEYLHYLGASDLYDTDGEGSGGFSKGMWKSTSIMDFGLYNNEGNTPPNLNAIERLQLGLAQADSLKIGSYIMHPEEKRILCSHGPTKGQSILFECRGNANWDQYIGGSGLLIYRIDQSTNAAGWSDFYKVELNAAERWQKNQVNCNPEYECAELVCADPQADTISKIFFPQADFTVFGSETSFRFSDGSTSNLALINIRKFDDGSVSFDVIEPLVFGDPVVFQDAAIISWTLDRHLDATNITSVECFDCRSGEPAGIIKAGYGNVTITRLQPKHRYRVKVIMNELFSANIEFTTKTKIYSLPPFIYLATANRNPDGSFAKDSKLPLVLYNANSVASVEWYFNNRAISTEDDGYYHLNSNGLLKAVVRFEDGSEEVIIKEINVK